MYSTPSISATFAIRWGSGSNAANARAISSSPSPATRISAAAASPFAHRTRLSKYDPARSAGPSTHGSSSPTRRFAIAQRRRLSAWYVAASPWRSRWSSCKLRIAAASKKSAGSEVVSSMKDDTSTTAHPVRSSRATSLTGRP